MKTTGYNSLNSWIATIACAITGFIILIPARLSGLFFVLFLEGYDTDRKMATLPIVIFGTIRTLFGVVIGVLGEIFGLQAVILVGCILATIGVGCTYFAEDITAVVITFGIIFGVGFSLANSLAHTVIRQHFNKNINLANGVYLTGTCLGASVMAPVVKHLAYHYGISGMFLILSGIFLHSIPACIFLKDPKNEERESHKLKKSEINELNNIVEDIDLATTCSQITKVEVEKNETLTNILNTKPDNTKNQSLKKSKREIMHQTFLLFVDPTFYLTIFIQSAHAVIATSHWTVVVDFGRDKGIPYDDCVYFVMCLPIAEIIGNLSLNWITDRSIMSRTNYCMICFICLGIDSGFIVWSNNFILMLIAVVVYGIICGTLNSTFPVVIMEFIHKDQQNVALASRFMPYAVLNLSVTPMVGYFRGQLGHYDWIYYIMMIACFCCSILIKLTPVLAACRAKRISK